MGRFIDRLRRPSADNIANSFMNQVIGNKADASAAGAVSTTETLMAYVKQLVGQREYVNAAAVVSPLATGDIFSITGGPVIVHEIFGIVTTTAIQAQATTIQLKLDPDDGGSDVALSSAGLDATGDPTGTIYRWTKDFSEAVIALLDAFEATDIQAPGVILMPGDISVTYGAASTGQINWYSIYERIGAGIMVAS